MEDSVKLEIVPGPKEIISRRGELRVPIGPGGTCVLISDEEARLPAGLIAERFKLATRFARAPIVSGEQAEGFHFRVNIIKELDFARKLSADQRVEAYRLEVSKEGIELSALTAEGLLRGAATLFQMTRFKNGMAIVPCAVINDWPNFRYRCASDWLINVECNRWAYDRGDGRAAFLERIKRKLDFCFEHKLNMAWFDGFGWDTERFPGYAALVKACNQYARRLGIKLLFGGYGGGYGTAYQAGEIYRCGYFGNVYLNRRTYPDGKEYACRGWPESKSRLYGTCLSNGQLRQAKLAELKRFVTEVNPGFMYIHEIDAGSWLPNQETWKQRCGECRKRWPNDELAAADGQAGACADWFAQVRRELSALPSSGDYSPARDLVLAFASPLYTDYQERKPENVWELEMQYFNVLSRLIGPEQGIEFVLREQFYDTENRKKTGRLRALLEQNGNGHGILIAAFGGGDNYISDDLTNISGAMAHFYDGAECVYLSNGGMHQEPVQMLNADFLWSGSAGGYRENPADETAAATVFQKIASREHKPAAIFKSGGYFDRLCVRLWGAKAGKLMSRALQVRRHGQRPVSHVWWSITQVLGQLKNEAAGVPLIDNFQDRKLATALALKLARKAAAISDHEDIHWFARCLEVGEQFAAAVSLLFQLKAGDQAAGARLKRVGADLKAHIRHLGAGKKTDRLGGDPGCWLDTLADIERLGASFGKRPKNGGFFSDFIFKWHVSRVMPPAGKLDKLGYPGKKGSLRFAPRVFTAAFCDVHDDLAAGASEDALIYFVSRIHGAAPGPVELRLGYDGPVKAWIDGREVFHDPNGTNPGVVDKAVIPWKATRKNHELTIALGSNHGKACGLYARLYRAGIACR